MPQNSLKPIHLLLSLFGGLLLLFSGCSSSTAVRQGTALDDQPEWVQTLGDYSTNFPGKEGIGAVASAPKSKLGSQVQREDALLAARNELATRIKARVRSVLSSTRQRLIEQGIEEAEELGTVNTQNAVQQKVDENLIGSRVVKQWMDPDSEELYVWVVLDGEGLAQMRSAIQREVMQQRLRDAEEKHRRMLKEAFDDEMQQLTE
jgi:hypothetical protein